MTFRPLQKEIPTTEESLKSGLCSQNTCKEEAKDEETSKKTRGGANRCIPCCGYSSITEFAKSNKMTVFKVRDRRDALIARGVKAEDITADDIINFVSMRGKCRRPKSATSCQQNVDNSKLDTSAIKQAVQQEGEFKGEEEKTEEKLDEKTQFENKDNAKKTTTDDYLDKLGQKYNENRIGDLEVEVKQLRKDFDNLKATIAKLDKLQVGGVALNEVLEQIIANIIIKTYAK